MRRSFRPSQNGAISEDSFRNNIENIQDYYWHGLRHGLFVSINYQGLRNFVLFSLLLHDETLSGWHIAHQLIVQA